MSRAPDLVHENDRELSTPIRYHEGMTKFMKIRDFHRSELKK